MKRGISLRPREVRIDATLFHLGEQQIGTVPVHLVSHSMAIDAATSHWVYRVALCQLPGCSPDGLARRRQHERSVSFCYLEDYETEL